MNPCGLIGARRQLMNARLDTTLPGFLCRLCRGSVSVTITIACTFTFTHPDGW